MKDINDWLKENYVDLPKIMSGYNPGSDCDRYYESDEGVHALTMVSKQLDFSLKKTSDDLLTCWANMLCYKGLMLLHNEEGLTGLYKLIIDSNTRELNEIQGIGLLEEAILKLDFKEKVNEVLNGEYLDLEPREKQTITKYYNERIKNLLCENEPDERIELKDAILKINSIEKKLGLKNS